MDTWDIWNSTNIIKCSIIVVAGVVILALNAAVVLAFLKTHRLRIPSNYFLCSLAVADILCALLVYPGHLMGEFAVFGEDEWACLAINCPALVLPCAALFSLIAASVERYIALMYPLRYPRLVSPKRIIWTIFAIWLFSLLLGILPLAGINNISERAEMNASLPYCNFIRVMPGKFVGAVTFGSYVPGMLVLAVVDFKVFQLACRQRQLLSRRSSDYRRGSVVFVLIVLGHIYVATHVPLLVVMAIDYKFYTINLVKVVSIDYSIYVLMISLVALCPIAYPLVMAFGNRDIRKAIRKLCSKSMPSSKDIPLAVLPVQNPTISSGTEETL